MAAERSFIQILEDEIRHDLRRELEAELAAREAARISAEARLRNTAASGRLEAWLASHVGPIKFKSQRQPYGPAPVRPQAPEPPPAMRQLTAAETLAVELLNRHSSVRLGTSFTEDELKTAWRKAAMKTHPDRFIGADAITILRMTALFRELADAYASLTALFEKDAASVG